MTNIEREVDKLAQAIWLAYMRPEQRRFAKWSANETKGVWIEKATDLIEQIAVVGLIIKEIGT